jgi:hypothetical protein
VLFAAPPLGRRQSPRAIVRGIGRRAVASGAESSRGRDLRRDLCGNLIYGMFVLDAIDATPARRRGDAGSSPLDGASAATSSPRNDLAKHLTLVDFHTGRHGLRSCRLVGVLLAKQSLLQRWRRRLQ